VNFSIFNFALCVGDCIITMDVAMDSYHLFKCKGTFVGHAVSQYAIHLLILIKKYMFLILVKYIMPWMQRPMSPLQHYLICM